jgi:hypothetical protein
MRTKIIYRQIPGFSRVGNIGLDRLECLSFIPSRSAIVGDKIGSSTCVAGLPHEGTGRSGGSQPLRGRRENARMRGNVGAQYRLEWVTVGGGVPMTSSIEGDAYGGVFFFSLPAHCDDFSSLRMPNEGKGGRDLRKSAQRDVTAIPSTLACGPALVHSWTCHCLIISRSLKPRDS